MFKLLFGSFLFVFCFYALETEAKERNILVFGGNGFLGASAVEKFLKTGDSITIVNRGNWYWDSKSKIKPHVKHIQCDRKKYLTENCPEFIEFLKTKKFSEFDTVIDFSAFSDNEIRESLKLLKGQAKLYVYISTDTIYDVCDAAPNTPIKEEAGVRPEDPERRSLLANHHAISNKKFKAEEELLAQRAQGGIPYIILRLPDVVGPRDTTFRFWIYLLWVKVAPELTYKPVNIPKFLKNVDNSFVFVDDVAKTIHKVSELAVTNKEVVDQAYNLAFKETVTIEQLLRTMEKHLGIPKQNFIIDDDNSVMYLYPMVRAGTLDTSKATKNLGWKPTSFDNAIKETVNFYESVMKGDKYIVQRDEIVQVQSSQFYGDHKEEFFNTLEKIYNINLSHFKPHDEL